MPTSKLQDYIYRRLLYKYPHAKIKFNHKPYWLLSSDLSRLEIDIYMPDFKVAIEVQGEQHFKYIAHFHKNYDGFRKRLRLDKEKRDLCYGRGIRLFEICQEIDLIRVVDYINDNYFKNEIEANPKKGEKELIAERRVLHKLRSPKSHHQSENVAAYIVRMINKEIPIEDKEVLEYYKENQSEVNEYILKFIPASNNVKIDKKNKIQTPAIKCIVIDESGITHGIISYPKKYGSFMLDCNELDKNYVFPSRSKALSAISHTWEYRKENNLDLINFSIKNI